MRSILRIAGISLIGLWSTAGFSFFDAEAFYGSTTSTLKYSLSDGDHTASVKGTEIGAALQIDPVPVVPVSFGLLVTQSTRDTKSIAEAEAADLLKDSIFGGGGTSSATSTSKTLLYGPVVKVWFPLFVKPYFRLAYMTGAEVQDSSYDIEGTTLQAKISPKTIYTTTATQMSLGLDYSPTKMVELFAEYAIISCKRKFKSISGDFTATNQYGSVTTPLDDTFVSDTDKSWNSGGMKSVRIGLSVGI